MPDTTWAGRVDEQTKQEALHELLLSATDKVMDYNKVQV